jgi:GNAT superfamily N-acetyltransferase
MSDLEVIPLTPERWDDLASLFGPNGANGGCWCMWWRLKGSEFSTNGNAGNRAAMRTIVQGNEIPGLLAYQDGVPVGWISLGPRELFGRLERSPALKPIDEQPVWSIVCFYIARGYRRQGVAHALVAVAVDHARQQGASALEAYPVSPEEGQKKDSGSLFTGTEDMFRDAGFTEIARRKAKRPILRLNL